MIGCCRSDATWIAEKQTVLGKVGEGTGMGSGTQLSTISHLKKIDNDAYSYQQLTFNSIIYLTTTADPFKIQVKSGGDGTGSLSSGSYFSIARIR